jgi:hypothetical protein
VTHTLAHNTDTSFASPAMQIQPHVFDLNQRYVYTVSRRSLCGASTVGTWKYQTVHVFLRHESDHVFAIATGNQIGIADYLAITNVTFDVDEAGRQEACQGNGALPNGRNVHVFVTDQLLWASMKSQLPITNDWQPVIYNPHQMKTFQLARNNQPIHKAEVVAFTPNLAQVWCVQPAVPDFQEAA